MHHKSILIINSANMQPRQKTPKVKFESEENTIEGQASQIEISEDLSDSKWLDKNSLVTKYHLDVLPDKKGTLFREVYIIKYCPTDKV